MISRLPLEAPDRLYFSELHSLAMDRHGNEVLCGLSREESIEFLSMGQDRARRCAESKARYRYLQEKCASISLALADAARNACRTGRIN